MKKVAVFGHDLKFISYITDYLTDSFDYQIKIDQWDGHDRHDETKSLELLEWADILFCEWGLGNVIWCQKHKKSNQRLIVRLHRFEMNTRFPALFDYKKIDQLIAISPYIYEEFHRVAKVPREKMKVIFNAVDTQRFAKDKVEDSKFNIGLIGYVPKLKRLDRAIDIFEKLYELDPRYKLYIKGKRPEEVDWVWKRASQREHYKDAFERIQQSKFKEHIFIEGWGDVSEWLKNVGYVLSVSDYESFHLAPIEGMASGAFPVVLQREGVRCVFQEKYIFENIEQAVTFISSKNNKDESELASYVEERFSLQKICEKMDELLRNA
ncbi:glycosyltransferase family 4 protein [Ornithinibacillus salinisoli]|uniref:Glycosyltransferase family 4 protein n=1 Tax=Ornithinibacillus salinisoli TaxID=1848459 RepID=A0ABW4VZ02_9BACI